MESLKYRELSKPLYHGSDATFSKVELSFSASRKDFGAGFYTTNDAVQAEKFARLKALRSGRESGYVYQFAYIPRQELKCKEFTSPGVEWFDFVLCNRGFERYASSRARERYDIVIGPVANDAVGLVLNQFVTGVFGDPEMPPARETAIRLLLTQKLHNQIFFANEAAVFGLEMIGRKDVPVKR